MKPPLFLIVLSCFCLKALAQQHLAGYVIGVDPGHGGTDTGAVGPNYVLTEKSVNLTTALALKKYLEADGATVVMTRTIDTFVSLPDRTTLFINNAVSFAISVHHNGGGSALNTSMVFIYCNASLATRGALASAVVQRLGISTGIPTSQNPASTSDTLCSGHSDWLTGISGVGQADLWMVQKPETAASIPSILAEISFITNPTEEAKLLNADYLDSNGWAIYAGLADYLGFTPRPRGADTDPPSLVIDFPPDNSVTTSSSVNVAGAASDNGHGNNGISSVTVNGMAANNGTATGANSAQWNLTVTLNPGPNPITVVAKDTFNNATQKQITVTYNADTNPPSLVIDFPPDNSVTTSSSVNVAGAASDNGHGNDGISSVTVNGIAAAGGIANGTDTANWSATVPLNPGVNTITVVATDGLGNQSPTTDYYHVQCAGDAAPDAGH